MYLVFEFLFYLGLLALCLGALGLIRMLVRRQWGGLKFPALLVALGIAAIAAPTIYTRFGDVDLGPRETLVQGEKHITLTGWDGEGYEVLRLHPETIVLQMANPDVTDDTLQYLRPMANLRELDLNDSQVSDAGTAELAKLTGLEVLRLRGTAITDIGLTEHLGRLPRLKRIDLRQTAVSDEAIEQWKHAGESRRVLR